jgi:5-methylcytosine-specific restriction endonuclease McrA
MCRACRKATGKRGVCVVCAGPTDRDRWGDYLRTCSSRCLALNRAATKVAMRTGFDARLRAAVPCRGCGGAATGLRQYCDTCRADRTRAAWQRKNAVRRGASPFGPDISLADLGQRDCWRCHLCRRKVDPTLPYQHRMAGTRDHLVPVSEGGDDTPANLRLAHRACNSARGTRGAVQLMLVG